MPQALLSVNEHEPLKYSPPTQGGNFWTRKENEKTKKLDSTVPQHFKPL